MTPSATIVAKATEARIVIDSLGRRLAIRNITALDRLRIFKAAGPELAMNQPWVAMAILASSITAIDNIPVPPPSTEQQVEALVVRLGDAGIEAITENLERLQEIDETVQVTNAGNSPGTLS